VTGHLAQFGAIEIPRRRYLRMLDQALTIETQFS
jgi:Leu/Phe-tRNA-protein transferase